MQLPFRYITPPLVLFRPVDLSEAQFASLYPERFAVPGSASKSFLKACTSVLGQAPQAAIEALCACILHGRRGDTIAHARVKSGNSKGLP